MKQVYIRTTYVVFSEHCLHLFNEACQMKWWNIKSSPQDYWLAENLTWTGDLYKQVDSSIVAHQILITHKLYDMMMLITTINMYAVFALHAWNVLPIQFGMAQSVWPIYILET